MPRKELKSIADLTPDDRNANVGSERGSQMIEDSLRNYGAGRSILLDKAGRIIGGNKTVEAAASVGMEDIIVVQTTGKQLVAVQRMDLDLEKDPKAKELALSDNRCGEVSLTWDVPVLVDLGREIDLSPFWTREEMEDLVQGMAIEGESEDAPTDPTMVECPHCGEQFEAKGNRANPIVGIS
jgi:hypothetical protein